MIKSLFAKYFQKSSPCRFSDSDKYFASLKNIYRGRRGFVIGNGPSLKLSDLDMLQDEITIASNKIYLAFESTPWRPDFFTVADPLVWEKIKDNLHPDITKVHLPDYLMIDKVNGVDIKVWRHIGAVSSCVDDKVDFSDDAVNGFYSSWTITYENLQFAAHLGLSPIYIIGCDHKYTGESNINPDNPVKVNSTNNHFISGYRVIGELVNPAPIELMNRGYAEAKKYSDIGNIKIYNATRGGYLDEFDRCDFDSLFE